MVINPKGVHSSNTAKKENIKTYGSYEGIDYVYTSGTALYPKNFIVRNILKIVGSINELIIILFYALTNKVGGVIVCTSSLTKLKYLWYVTRLTNTRLVYDYVEYFSSLEDRSMKTPNDKKNFDTVFFQYTDALIIISSYLEQHLIRMKSTRPYVIVPPIIDFEKFSRINSKPKESDYFLYCGSVQYIDVIAFIIEAFHKSTSNGRGVSLILILSGSSGIISNIRESTREDKTIKILSGLPYEDLIGYYKNAKALLIPLQDNLQDKARFPFKISEYTAAARPIITSDSGAIVEYFQDGENALVAKTGDMIDFSTKLNFILDNPREADDIGLHGHDLGQEYFNYKSYTSTLLNLLSKKRSLG